MSLKQIVGNLSDLEERIINALYMIDKPGDGGPTVGSLKIMLGGRWTRYRQAILDGMAEKHLIDAFLLDEGLITLTPEAYGAVTQRIKKAQAEFRSHEFFHAADLGADFDDIPF